MKRTAALITGLTATAFVLGILAFLSAPLKPVSQDSELESITRQKIAESIVNDSNTLVRQKTAGIPHRDKVAISGKIQKEIEPYEDLRFQIGVTPLNSDLGIDFGDENQPELAAFSSWISAELAKPEGLRFSNTESGLELANARATALEALIESDPKSAIRAAIPTEIRDQLPAAILAASENFVEGTGDFGVVKVCSAGSLHTRNETLRSFTLPNEGIRYSAFVYGNRAASHSNDELPAHGIAVGEKLAISESPVRVIESQSHADGGAATVQFGSETLELASLDSAAGLARRQLQLERSPGANGNATTTNERRLRSLRSPTTEGVKKWLVIRVDFSDLTGTPVVGNFYADAGQTMTTTYLNDQVNNVLGPHFAEISFGKYSIMNHTATDVTPVYRMPDRIAQYVNRDIWDDLADDAKAAAEDDGYTLEDYDVYYIVTSEHNGEFSGIATFGGNDYAMGNGTFDIATTIHEVGHNLSLDHGNLWEPNSASAPSGSGKSIEYGDSWDVMGSDNAYWGIPDAALHTAPPQMEILDWLIPASIVDVQSVGSYRVYRYDSQTADQNRTLALKIHRNSNKYFWIAYRHDLNGLGGEVADMSDGAYITVSGYGPDTQSNLIDLGADPQDEDGDIRDASLNVGDSFSDATAGLTVTVTAKGGTGDDAYIDVDITLPQVPVIDPIVVPPAAVSGELSINFTASDGATKFRVFGLPRGLKYDPKTGEIYGKPSRSGTFDVSVYAYNGVGRSQPLEFELVVQPIADAQIGIFENLVDADSDVNLDLGGRLTFKTTSTGSISGILRNGNETIRFKGRLDVTPGGVATYAVSRKRRDKTFLDVALTIETDGSVTGTLMDSLANTTNFDGDKFTFHKRNNPATDFVGRFNTRLDLQGGDVGNQALPQGSGYLVHKVSSSGAVKWSGYTADGLKSTGGTRLIDNNNGTVDIVQFAKISRGIASLHGRPMIDSTNDTVSGNLDWKKRESTSSKARNYKTGFDPITLDLAGALYIRPLSGELLLNISPDASVDIFFFEGGINSSAFAANLNQQVTVGAKHRITYVDKAGPVNPAKVRLKFNPRHGLFTGSFQLLDPNPFAPEKNQRRIAKFRGIIISGDDRATGFFRLAEQGDPGSDPVVPNNRTAILSGMVRVDAG